MVAAPRSVVNAGRSAGHGAIQDRPCRIPASRTRRRGRRCHAGPDDDESEVDIDELAERLMREAASSAGINSDSNAGAGPAQPTTWQGVLDTFDAGRLGEFYPEEFELLKEQGRLGSAGGDPVLIAYAGRFYSGMPFEDPVLVSLREFVPNEQDEMLGVRELIVLSHLCNGFPPRDRRWKVASAYPDRKTDPPVMTLLGYFVAGTTLPGSSQNSIWIVQQWDGFAPLEGYSVAQQTSGFGLVCLCTRSPIRYFLAASPCRSYARPGPPVWRRDASRERPRADDQSDHQGHARGGRVPARCVRRTRRFVDGGVPAEHL